MDKKANPDCRTCRRRRIRCDRQRPSCLKCVSRDLTCPGYGRRIQWVNGVASRGRLKGHPTPNPDHHHQDDAPESEHVDSAAATSSPRDGQVTDQHIQDVETGAVVLFQPRRLPELREDTAVFLDYYDKSIAGLMVWFDSDDNAYRSCALPLARRQPGLFLAIAAVSAYHGSSASPSFPDQARDRCLAVLNQSTQDLTRRLSTGSNLSARSDTLQAECLLASILVISTYEMVRGRILASEGHKRAARSLLNLFTSSSSSSSSSSPSSQSDFFLFLRNQLAIHDVLSSITAFHDPSDLLATVVPYHTPRTLFTDYLSLVHAVTLLSRNLPPPPLESHYSLADPPSTRDAFEQARAATLLASAHLPFKTAPLRRDFTRIVDIFHSAALLYAHRCLGFISVDPAAALEHALLSRRLLDQLLRLEDLRAWPQNLLWPAFIAGVECRGDGGAQGVVEGLCRSLYEVTRFGHYLGVLDFLRAFWAGDRDDWRGLAGEWEAEGRRVLLS
ncbi:unnamed protein product [Clonostachys solani]|uniref:Zn(2)-C6 fungal-type domain-containing protein n=1 Tax=Clonostachys solani TaxID=160281 RepID=A0A9P0EPL3_9HYPO|nr:unnamed protein product [Clonostachys solani]